MKSWLVALRIARREALRAKGRTLLIVAMIAVPVAALSFAAATYDMYKLTPEEAVTRQMGSADAIVTWDGQDPSNPDLAPTPTTAALLAHLPTGSRASAFWQDSVLLHTAAGIGSLEAYHLDAHDPMTSGLVTIDSGRVPQTGDEVLVSPSTLVRLGLRVGDSVHSAGADSRTYTIVGVGEVQGSLRDYVMFQAGSDDQGAWGWWLVETPGPVTLAQVESLSQYGIEATSRELTLHPPATMVEPSIDPTVAGFTLFGIGTLIGGLGLLEVVLLAGPAFAVGARRRQRELALVATSGGTPSTLRRIVLADGSWVASRRPSSARSSVSRRPSPPGRSWRSIWRTPGSARTGSTPSRSSPVVGLALLTGVLGALVPA